jgi:hypothetical protein
VVLDEGEVASWRLVACPSSSTATYRFFLTAASRTLMAFGARRPSIGIWKIMCPPPRGTANSRNTNCGTKC